MKKFPQQKGFVILFTILISTIILMIGLGIFSIATREVVLSGTAREAQYAFYAADAGIECALYAESLGVFVPGGGSFECGVNSVTVEGDGLYSFPFTFNVLVDGDQKTCAVVTAFDSSTAEGAPARRIISQGYNACDADGKPLTKNPILVERDLDILYQTGAVGNIITVPPAGTDKPLVPGTTILDKNPDIFLNTQKVQTGQ